MSSFPGRSPPGRPERNAVDLSDIVAAAVVVLLAIIFCMWLEAEDE